jgi:hypothetical protein
LDKMDVAMKADQEKMESRNNWKPELRLWRGHSGDLSEHQRTDLGTSDQL